MKKLLFGLLIMTSTSLLATGLSPLMEQLENNIEQIENHETEIDSLLDKLSKFRRSSKYLKCLGELAEIWTTTNYCDQFNDEIINLLERLEEEIEKGRENLTLQYIEFDLLISEFSKKLNHLSNLDLNRKIKILYGKIEINLCLTNLQLLIKDRVRALSVALSENDSLAERTCSNFWHFGKVKAKCLFRTLEDKVIKDELRAMDKNTLEMFIFSKDQYSKLIDYLASVQNFRDYNVLED